MRAAFLSTTRVHRTFSRQLRRYTSRLSFAQLFVLTFTLLLAASFLLIVRGPLRSADSFDFAAPYVASARLLEGLDPYNTEGFKRDWQLHGASPDAVIDRSGQMPIYPPPTLMVIAPLTLLHWKQARSVLIWGSAFGYILVLGLLGFNDKQPILGPRLLCFWLVGLLLAPVQAALHVGNLSLLAFVLCAFAAYFSRRQWAVLGGCALAIGFCLKPTTAFTIVLFFLLTRQFRALAVSSVVSLGLSVLSFLCIRSNPSWSLHYQSNLAYLFGPHGVASFLGENELRYQLINLQVPLYSLLGNRALTNMVAYLLTGAMALVWYRLHSTTSREDEWNWTCFAALAVLCLFPVYQRSYNDCFVLFAVLAAFENLRYRSARLILLVMPVFLLPVEEVLRLRLAPHLGDAFIHSLAWTAGIMPVNTWATLTIECLLLGLMWEQRRNVGYVAERMEVRKRLALFHGWQPDTGLDVEGARF